ncbi:MAG: methyltransferase domain-containing protein [Acidobacteriia bacterium]|nr:methyltransferase domain-containing protein [Terriglobia bacterium]
MSISNNPKSQLAVDREAKNCAEIVGRSLGAYLKTVGLVSDAYLAQVLVALWDSGLYEYVREHGRIEISGAAEELNLEPAVLRSLIEYLVGWSILAPDGDSFVLSKKGQPYWNYITRGVLTAHLAGYNQLLVNLGPLLRKEISLNDPRLDRSGRLVASGSGYALLGSGTIPWILKLIRQIGGTYVMDIGCGSGDFLIQLALRWEDGAGIGIDMNAEAIAQAGVNAERCGVSHRLTFHHAKLSAEPMPLDKSVLEKVDTLTAMYLLHEFAGRGGPAAITAAISQLKQQFPGRKLLMLEGERADPAALCAAPPRTYAQLDYSFIHPLSRQGPLRTPAEWGEIIKSAGATLIERIPGFGQVPGWISLYIIALE